MHRELDGRLVLEEDDGWGEENALQVLHLEEGGRGDM